ncbi:cbb3-type cytochrome oxidase assembly protein CcoS [Rufibacter psychrotolerans]|uniref:cbb3-type cytochrome oxidase assembly protein CcoS n=1 Tax=Rufibacter psychrotolerans TaxID=2812556 RepID=UPI001968951A|nr:cbb3-type cytochrome oxidase assembly protein CcoS [Rufibacter sp. SYSU D00308]
MNIIFLLICISLLVALLFLGAFLWAVRSGQYEDDYTPSVRILFDHESTQKQPITTISTKPMEDTAHVS